MVGLVERAGDGPVLERLRAGARAEELRVEHDRLAAFHHAVRDHVPPALR
jgi:hypothetical protein